MKELDDFFSQFPIRSYKKGKLLLKKDDPIKKIFYLISGNVNQYSESSLAEKISIHIYRPGSFFPIALELAGEQNRFYFESVNNIKVQVAPYQKVVKMLKDNPRVLFDLTRRLAKGLDGVVKRLEDALGYDVHLRLISLITYFANSFGSQGKKGSTIQLPFTHQELAGWLGVSRETITRQMRSLQKQGLIYYKRRKIILLANTNK